MTELTRFKEFATDATLWIFITNRTTVRRILMRAHPPRRPGLHPLAERLPSAETAQVSASKARNPTDTAHP